MTNVWVLQTKVMLRKNFLTKKTKYFALIFQILLPAIFLAILIPIRSVVPPVYESPSYPGSQNVQQSSFFLSNTTVGFVIPEWKDEAQQAYVKALMTSMRDHNDILEFKLFRTEEEMVEALNVVAAGTEKARKFGKVRNIGLVFTQMSPDPKAAQQWAYTIRVDGLVLNENSGGYDYLRSNFLIIQSQVESFIVSNAAGPTPVNATLSALQPSLQQTPAQVTRRIMSTSTSVDAPLHGSAYIPHVVPLAEDAAVGENVWSRGWRKLLTYTDANIRALPFPTAGYMFNGFMNAVGEFVLPLILLIAYMYPFMKMVTDIVDEKENRLKEGLQVMGLKSEVFWISWTITNVIICTITACVVSAMLCLGNIFSESSGVLVFLFCWLFSLSQVAYANMYTTLFSRAKTASYLSILFFVASFAGFIVSKLTTLSRPLKLLLSIMSPTAFGLAINNFSHFEESMVGAQFSNMGEEIDNYDLRSCFLMMAFDTVLYFLLTFYLDRVLPSEFGLQESAFFCLRPSFYCKKKGVAGSASNSSTGLLSDAASDNMGMTPLPVGDHLEAVDMPLGETKGVRIRGLNKTFDVQGSKVYAVNNLSLDIVPGQVFCLLGHNGAGKSTTINMLSGMLPITGDSGDAWINGKSIRTDMNEIRMKLGVCPQHSILWPNLTVRQHCEIFATLKGVPEPLQEEEINKIIGLVGLTDKAEAWSSALSGGMQRKLSLALALIGDSPVVFLDEPTSGMDPSARKFTQALIRSIKKDRVVVLTTHYMEEADALADRIGIMGGGKLLTCGSPLFLKNKYGVGYCFVVTKEDQCTDDKAAAITAVIKKFSKAAEIVSEAGTEQVYALPFSDSKHFSAMLTELDANKKKLMISHYSLSVTTLEEVFVKVAALTHTEIQRRRTVGSISQDERPTKPPHKPKTITFNDASIATGSPSSTGIDLREKAAGSSALGESLRATKAMFHVDGASFCTHIKAIYEKRFRIARRDRTAFCCQVLTPLTVLLAGFLLMNLLLNGKPERLLIQSDTLSSLPLNIPLATVVDRGQLRQSSDAPIPANGHVFTTLAAAGVVCDLATLEQYTAATKALAPHFDKVPKQFANEGEFSRWLLANQQPAPADESRQSAFLYDATSQQMAVAYSSDVGQALPANINLLSTACLQQVAKDPTADIEVTSYPFPLAADQKQQVAKIKATLISFIVSIAFIFIPASFVQFIIQERFIQAKHQQIISGVSGLAYWTANLLWDLTSYSIPCIGSAILIQIVKNPILTDPHTFATLMVVFALFGPSIIAFTHCASNLFDRPGSGQNAVIIWFIFSGVFLNLVAAFLGLLLGDKAADVLNVVFKIFPNYALGHSLDQLVSGGPGSSDAKMSPGTVTNNFYQWDVCGADIFMMSVAFFFFFGVTVLIEFLKTRPSCRGDEFKAEEPLPPPDNEDSDVKEEREAMQGGATNVIRVEGLRKKFTKNQKACACCHGGTKQTVTAVRNLWYGVPEGQCFGFLGVNGAGKTTTLQMLSGNTFPSSGQAYLGGLNILTQQNELRRKLGYCPQFDPLFELLTGREHVELAAKIKGVLPAFREHVVEKMLNDLNLKEFADKPAGGYSGGNKRKLTVACALTGSPSIVFLDEPSTGMDPVSRRFMWDYIAHTMQGRSVILTTHSMEEAEALCQRIGIMVAGQLRCLGTPRHLKHKFGQGFKVEFTTVNDISIHEALIAFVRATFEKDNHVVLLSHIGSQFKFHLQSKQASAVASQQPATLTLATIFAAIEDNKQKLDIKEYAVSETTLEEVFLSFADEKVDALQSVSSI